MGAVKEVPTQPSADGDSPAGNFTVALWMVLWVTLSVVIINVNKHVLYYTHFQYPLLLAVWHMVLASVTTRTAIKVLGRTDTIKENGNWHSYLQLAMIGLLFGCVLATANAAMLYISIPAVQMLKAGTPVITYILGISLGTEKPQLLQAIKIATVCFGVVIASSGDISLTLVGFALQAGSISMDALRCCFLQKVLQGNKVNAGPLVTLSYVAPFSATALLLPMLFVEGPHVVLQYQDWKPAIPSVLLSGLLATALNFVVFKVIKLTSALISSLTGVMKDWVCILVAMHLYGTAVTQTQWAGYAVAISGLIWYNVGRFKAGRALGVSANEPEAGELAELEKKPLLAIKVEQK